MRILHVTPSLSPAAGGPPNSSSRLAAAQADLGHEVRLLGYENKPDEIGAQQYLACIPGIERVVLHLLPPRTNGEFLLAANVHSEVQRLVRQFDIVHLHEVFSTAAKAAASAARRASVPYVVAPRGCLDPWSLQQKWWKKRLALALGFRGMLDSAAFLHVLNCDEQELIRPLGLRCPTEVLPNGIFLDEVDRYLPPPGQFFSRHPELEGKPFILFLGRLHFKKGLDLLGKAFALLSSKLPDVQLVVIGPDGGMQSTFDYQMTKAKIRDRVHVLGPIYGPAKLAALVDAICVCQLSRQEGFSMTLLESLACSKPVVISRECHFPEVEKMGAGIVVPLEPIAAATALCRLLKDAELRGQMASAARNLVESHFTWPQIAERCVTAYDQVCLVRQFSDRPRMTPISDWSISLASKLLAKVKAGKRPQRL